MIKYHVCGVKWDEVRAFAMCARKIQKIVWGFVGIAIGFWFLIAMVGLYEGAQFLIKHWQ
jgi:hypothetical protein